MKTYAGGKQKGIANQIDDKQIDVRQSIVPFNVAKQV